MVVGGGCGVWGEWDHAGDIGGDGEKSWIGGVRKRGRREGRDGCT